MVLCDATLIKLRKIINGDENPFAIYRRGQDLVKFFNKLGSHEIYGRGFPSRWKYTDEKLSQINGTPEIDKCIKMTFAPVNFRERINDLDALIASFNSVLQFDKWQVVREEDAISLKKIDKVKIEEFVNSNNDSGSITEDDFLKLSFNVNISKIGLDPYFSQNITARLKEAEFCAKGEAPLSAVVMIGSILEGILLGIALMYPKDFNTAQSAPKNKEGKVKFFQEWSLNDLIDVSTEVGCLKLDVKKFSHFVRDFRNYIHPNQQIVCKFTPDKNTALICLQVLKAAICQISDFKNKHCI